MTHHRHETDVINTFETFSGSLLWASTQSEQTRKEILLPHLLHGVLSQEEGELYDKMWLSMSELLDYSYFVINGKKWVFPDSRHLI